jgi:hypothetical protein
VAWPEQVSFFLGTKHGPGKPVERKAFGNGVFFLETGRFSKTNREAIKHEPGSRREGSAA